VATVLFSRQLRQYTGGVERVEIPADRVRGLISALYLRYPALDGKLEGMAIAIDDDIHRDALYRSLEPECEVVFLPPVAGGA
jgi:molybdopterin converting factor small subunit